jgi:WD40 repeat protein
MTAQADLDRRLRAHLEATADRTVLEGQLDAVLAETTVTRQRPRWLAARRERSIGPGAVGVPLPTVPRAAWVLAGTALLVLLLIAALAIGTRPGPARLTGQIVFGRAAYPGADPTVHVMNADGSGDRVLMTPPQESAFWSPDGRRVGFIDGYANADGGGAHSVPLVQGAMTLTCWDWSPDGRRCAAQGSNQVASRNGIYLLNAEDHGDPVQLTHGHDIPGAFSPDGSRIAFVRLPHHGQEGPLRVIGVDGQGERQVGALLVNRELAWAPDSRSLTVVSGGRLFRVDLATGTTQPIQPADGARADVLGVIVSPDGSRLLVRRLEQPGNADLFTMQVDGSDVVRLTDTPENEAFADWGPEAPSTEPSR